MKLMGIFTVDFITIMLRKNWLFTVIIIIIGIYIYIDIMCVRWNVEMHIKGTSLAIDAN